MTCYFIVLFKLSSSKHTISYNRDSVAKHLWKEWIKQLYITSLQAFSEPILHYSVLWIHKEDLEYKISKNYFPTKSYFCCSCLLVIYFLTLTGRVLEEVWEMPIQKKGKGEKGSEVLVLIQALPLTSCVRSLWTVVISPFITEDAN